MNANAETLRNTNKLLKKLNEIIDLDLHRPDYPVKPVNGAIKASYAMIKVMAFKAQIQRQTPN